jgi:uncharacterized protein (DUF1330 family)
MRDPSWTKEYGPKTAELVKKHGGRYIVRGGQMERLEGKEALPSVVVVLEFPTMQQARAWHSDPEYQPMIKLRQQGSDLEFILVEGA